MTKQAIKRHLSAIVCSIALIISVLGIGFVHDVDAAKVLVDENGYIDADITKGENDGTVDIPALSNNILDTLRFYLSGCSGIVLITLTLGFVIKCGQLAVSADNAQKRSNHISGLLWVLICIGLLGSFNTIMAIISTLAVKGL